jgi:hypothetical protein
MGRYNPTAPSVLSNIPGGSTIEDQSDSAGSLYINDEGRKASYRAVTSGVVVTANGVFLQIIGSATKTIRINRIFCTGVLTTGAQVLVQVQRTTAAASAVAGAVAITPTRLDTANAVATAVPTSYTSATLGTGNTLLATARAVFSPATALSTPAEFIFGTRNAQALVIRGTSEWAQVTVSTASYIGALFDISLEFTEE